MLIICAMPLLRHASKLRESSRDSGDRKIVASCAEQLESLARELALLSTHWARPLCFYRRTYQSSWLIDENRPSSVVCFDFVLCRHAPTPVRVTTVGNAIRVRASQETLFPVVGSMTKNIDNGEKLIGEVQICSGIIRRSAYSLRMSDLSRRTACFSSNAQHSVWPTSTRMCASRCAVRTRKWLKVHSLRCIDLASYNRLKRCSQWSLLWTQTKGKSR